MSLFNRFRNLLRAPAPPLPPSEQPIPEAEKGLYVEKEFPTHSPMSIIIPFEERKKTCIPSHRGLYVAEILLLEYCSFGTYPNPRNGYPRFWWFEYGIKNVNAVLQSLQDQGYITYELPGESLHRVTVAQLREMLNYAGLSTTGKKAELVERLREEVPAAVLETMIPVRRYQLTTLGEEELQENAYVPYMHKHPRRCDEFNVWTINRLLGHGSKSNWRQVVDEQEQSVLEEQARKYAESQARLRTIDPKLAAQLDAQDQQLAEIQAAEKRYQTDHDIEALIQFWEILWRTKKLLFNGSHWSFRLADLYQEQHRYQDALSFLDYLEHTEGFQYQDRLHKLRKQIQKTEKKNRHPKDG